MFNNLPPALKNLLIINVLVFFAVQLLQGPLGVNLNQLLGLHYFQAEAFKPFQLITYMFLHGDIRHLFFNMFGLFMFGRVLEQVWGSKRFLIYYFVTGIGAALIQQTVQFFEFREYYQHFNDLLLNFPENGINLDGTMLDTKDELLAFKDSFFNQFITIGASGSVFGVLLAFGMLFPNTEMFIMFIPIPIKAKYMVIGYGVIELFSGLAPRTSNVAHFAHLGGMLFGFFLIRYWRKHSNKFY